VLAPVDVKDCYHLTIKAFNLAEELRCPVFIASNKEIGMTRESIDMDSLVMPKISEREAPPPGEPFLPFEIPPGREVPYFLPIGDKVLVRQTSSTHGPDGYITTDPNQMAESRGRLMRKLHGAVDRFSFYEAHMENDADTLLLTYGVTARAAKDVFEERKSGRKPISLLVLKTLWPVPANLIKEKTKDVKRIVVLEMNLGQYVGEVRRVLCDKRVDFFGQMDGRLINPQQIKEVINHGQSLE
jgi:2-oxoglutarate ferredoxin oxidoreductase subunit alpha